MKHFDIIVIGSGIAGMSLGSTISAQRNVAIIEKEKQLSYHSVSYTHLTLPTKRIV